MPTYDYECPVCGATKELFLSISEAEDQIFLPCETKETTCKFNKVLLGAPEFRLKGKGWYETDFKNSANENVRRIEQ